MQLCWCGLVLLGGGPSLEWGLPSCHSVPCVFQMPQVLVKLKKYPQGDKVRLMVLCLACVGKCSLSQKPSLMEQVGTGGGGPVPVAW